MTNSEWLSNLKAGDDVYIDAKKHIAQVARLTKTQIIVGLTRFRRNDGRQIGGSPYFKSRIQFPTPEHHAEIRKQTLINHLKRVHWEEQSLDLLERVWKEIETDHFT